jgi:zeta-carotene desaturase
VEQDCPVSDRTSSRKVVVVGAGVAGLAAAVALAQEGVAVTLLERRPYVGGRAYSYLHPALHEVVDSQHVLVGCCTNLIDLCNQAGLADKIRWYDRQTWLEPATSVRPVRATTIAIGPLPAPLQFAGSFLRAPMLDLADKLAIARALMGLANGAEQPDSVSVAQWLRRTRQTDRAIRHLWEPLVLATLNDTAANCTMRYAGKVFYELFLKNRTGGRLGIPIVPLSDFYAAAADLFLAHGGQVQLRSSVEQLIQQPDGPWLLRCADRDYLADDVILALPFEQTNRLLSTMSLCDPGGEAPRSTLLTDLAHFAHSPFLSILLWYDRPITDLHHAWLLDSPLHWFVNKSLVRSPENAGVPHPSGNEGWDVSGPESAGVPHPSRSEGWEVSPPSTSGTYVEVIIAGSRTTLTHSREQILAPALAELARFFPETRHARLLKSGILKEARATFSHPPGHDHLRPSQRTAWPGLFLAGDWTATGWPSTMEGAARSGRLAAGTLLADPTRFLTPDPLPSALMRLLARSRN